MLPRVGAAVSGAPDAYRYLSDTVDSYRTGPQLAELAAAADWSGVEFRGLTFGTVGPPRRPRMIELGWDQVLAFRLARHGLDERRPLSALEVSRRINGIHAQVMSAAELSIGARSSAESPAGVQESLWEKRSLVKTWAMRTTLHLLPADELPLYMAAVRRRGPAWKRTWSKWLGIDEGQLLELVEAVGQGPRRSLPDPPRAGRGGGRAARLDEPRAAAERLGDLARAARPPGEALLRALAGDQCPLRPARPVDRLLDEVDELEAEMELLRRYLRVNGPAVRNDFQRWLGATPSLPAWKAVLPELVEVSVEGTRGWLLAADVDAIRKARFGDEVRLLPFFDHYLLTQHRARAPGRAGAQGEGLPDRRLGDADGSHPGPGRRHLGPDQGGGDGHRVPAAQR